jgi:hypothetical protein
MVNFRKRVEIARPAAALESLPVMKERELDGLSADPTPEVEVVAVF